jgi:tetratricopeptide (TPR) repeat protein
MSTLCEKLYLFIDGELTQEECERVREHLGQCEACARGFQDALQLEVLAAEAFGDSQAPRPVPARRLVLVPRPAALAAPPSTPPPVRKQRRVWGGAVAAAALTAMVYVSLPAPGPAPELWLVEAPTRRLEERLSFERLDVHRPFVPMRGGSSTAVEPVPLGELSRLDEAKDASAIAAAFLVRGDVEQARGFLEAAPASPERDNDLAVVAMHRGELHEALRLLERVLRVDPGHAQALWNQALVLRDLGQQELAVQAFEQLASRGEPGWSQEATRNAQALRLSIHP